MESGHHTHGFVLLPPWFYLVSSNSGHNDICTHPCNTSYTAFDASPPMYRYVTCCLTHSERSTTPNWNDRKYLSLHRKRMAQALDMLRDNLPRSENYKVWDLPIHRLWFDDLIINQGTIWTLGDNSKLFPLRTFVNMVPLIDVTVTLGMEDKHPFCYISHPYVCPCLYGAGKSIWGGGTPLGRWQNIANKEYIKNLGLCNEFASSGRGWKGCRWAMSGNFVTW